MSGESGANGEVRGFVVANFSDDDHLGILPQQMACGRREIQSARFIDFRLHDAGNHLFDGIFNRDDVTSAGFGKVTQARVNRRRFSAASRAGQKEQAGILSEEMF